jgi:hypothetical protein
LPPVGAKCGALTESVVAVTIRRQKAAARLHPMSAVIDRCYSYEKRGLEFFPCAARRFVAKRIFVKSKQIYF